MTSLDVSFMIDWTQSTQLITGALRKLVNKGYLEQAFHPPGMGPKPPGHYPVLYYRMTDGAREFLKSYEAVSVPNKPANPELELLDVLESLASVRQPAKEEDLVGWLQMPKSAVEVHLRVARERKLTQKITEGWVLLPAGMEYITRPDVQLINR